VRVGPRPTIAVRVSVEVGFEVVCSLLFVPHRSGSQAVECINMFESPHSLR